MTLIAGGQKPLVSIVTPCFNEEANVDAHFAAVRAELDPLSDRFDFEHIYTDNRSEDATFEKLTALAHRHQNVRVLRFSRNIGAMRAVYQGLAHARGDAAILIQADLQDPPGLIPHFIREWENGHDVVYGQINAREESLVMRFLRRAFYKLVAKLASVPPAENAGEFRLTSRRVLDALKHFGEDDPFIRGVIAQIGFSQKAVPYSRERRKRGRSNHGLLFLLGYAIDAIASTSVAPLRLLTVTGALAMAAGFCCAAYLLGLRFFSPAPSDFATLAALIAFFAGSQLFALAIIGEYLRKVYLQSLRRPQAIIQDRLNFE